MADFTAEEKDRLISAAIRMLNRPQPTAAELTRPVHECCYKEPEIDLVINDVQEQRKRRWAVILLVVGSMLAVASGIVTIGLWAGDLQSATEMHGSEMRQNREDIRALRRDLLDVERANGERVNRIENAVGRLEQRVEDMADHAKVPPRGRAGRD